MISTIALFVAGIILGGIFLYFGSLSFLLLTGPFVVIGSLHLIPITVQKTLRIWKEFQWWHACWILTFLSGLVFRIRETESAADAPLDFWALYRIFLVCVVAFLLLSRLIQGQPDWFPTLFQGLFAFLSIYAFLNVLTTLWSNYPAWTFYKSMEYVIDLLLITAIVTTATLTKEWQSLFNLTWLLLAGLLGSVVLGICLWPYEALSLGVGMLQVQIQGVLPNIGSNGVGQIAAILCMVAFVRLWAGEKDKRFYLAILVGTFTLLILAQTRSALLGLLVGLTVVLFVTGRIGPGTLLLSFLGAVVCLGPFNTILWEYFLRGQNPELFSSLSGRTVWWEFGWNLFLERPFTGHGAYAGSRFGALVEAGSTTTSSIHNAWLEILLGSGIPGLFFFSLGFLGIWKSLYRTRVHFSFELTQRNLVIEAIGVLTVLSVRSLFSSGLIWHPSLSFLLILGFAEHLRRSSKPAVQ